MIVTLLGVRGSRPVATMDTFRYGGNTTCFKVEVRDMPPILIDGGTGLYQEGLRLVQDEEASELLIFITHTHWDHILAFPFFQPLYDPRCKIIFHAPVSRNHRFIELIQGQHFPRVFPVPYQELRAQQSYIDAKPGGVFQYGRLTATAFQLNHPGVTLGWRFEADRRRVCIITDTAPIEDNHLGEGMEEAAKEDPKRFEQEWTENLLAFIHKADLVIYDTHFTAEGIKGKRHWGHSTPEMAIEHCKLAQARHLILHHHAPEDTDEVVNGKAEASWKAVKDSELQVEPGVEGMKIWL